MSSYRERIVSDHICLRWTTTSLVNFRIRIQFTDVHHLWKTRSRQIYTKFVKFCFKPSDILAPEALVAINKRSSFAGQWESGEGRISSIVDVVHMAENYVVEVFKFYQVDERTLVEILGCIEIPSRKSIIRAPYISINKGMVNDWEEVRGPAFRPCHQALGLELGRSHACLWGRR